MKLTASSDVKKIFTLAALLMPLGSVRGQGDIGCFVPGECRDSITLGLFSSSSSVECLNQCKGTAGCRYFTHFEADDVCFAFQNCPTFAEGFCSQCTSGEVGCSSFLCDLPGQCVGSLVGVETGVCLLYTSPSPRD